MFTINHKFQRTLENQGKLFSGMHHAAVAAAAILFNRIEKNGEIRVAQPLRQADDLMLVFEEEDRLALPLLGVNNGGTLFGLFDKIADTHAKGVWQA